MPANRPNILYIMSDDHAANAISCYGSRLASVFKTPNMDRIAAEGVRLDNFFSTNSICTPARASILTGQYGHVNGVRTLNDPLRAGYSPNLPVLLRQAGYQTCLFGKWHLHCTPEGFDEYRFLSAAGGQGTYRDPEFTVKDRACGVVKYKGYVTDIITEMALEWLRNRDPGRPFCMMCHHKAPHDYWEYPERHERLFDGLTIPAPDSLFEDRSHRSIASRDEVLSYRFPRDRVNDLVRNMDAVAATSGEFFLGCDVSPCVFEMYWRLRGMETTLVEMAADPARDTRPEHLRHVRGRRSEPRENLRRGRPHPEPRTPLTRYGLQIVASMARSSSAGPLK